MLTRGLSKAAINAAITDLCHQATLAFAARNELKAQLALEAISLLVPWPPARPAPVVIVDDDPDTREELGAALRERDYEVLSFADGAEALRHLRDDPCVSVILLDLMMPGMDGWTFHQEVDCDVQLARIPVIAMTGNLVDAPSTTALLRKPLRIAELLAVLERTLGRDQLS